MAIQVRLTMSSNILAKVKAIVSLGVAIEWGAVGDVGIVLEKLGDNSTIVGGTVPQRMPSCLAILDVFLCWNHPVISSYIRYTTESLFVVVRLVYH